MFCVLINMASCKLLSAKCCIRNHTLYSKLHSEIALFCHKCAVLNFLKVTDVTCMVLIKLFIKLIACKNCLVCVDNNYEVTAIYIWCEDWLVLTSEKSCSFTCYTTKRLAGCINNIPVTSDFVSFW